MEWLTRGQLQTMVGGVGFIIFFLYFLKSMYGLREPVREREREKILGSRQIKSGRHEGEELETEWLDDRPDHGEPPETELL